VNFPAPYSSNTETAICAEDRSRQIHTGLTGIPSNPTPLQNAGAWSTTSRFWSYDSIDDKSARDLTKTIRRTSHQRRTGPVAEFRPKTCHKNMVARVSAAALSHRRLTPPQSGADPNPSNLPKETPLDTILLVALSLALLLAVMALVHQLRLRRALQRLLRRLLERWRTHEHE